VAGRQALDAGKYGVRGQRGPEGEDLRQGAWIDAPFDLGQGKEGLDLGAEQQPARCGGVEERPDAGAVARQHQPPPREIPKGDGELAVEAVDEPLAVLLVGMHDDLGVRARMETMPGLLELAPPLELIAAPAVTA